MHVTERVIEDILSTDTSILAEILNIEKNEINLLARQKSLPSGKLDLLLLYKKEILLIELKVVKFSSDIIDQINNYYFDLKKLQNTGKLISGNIRKIVLVPSLNSQNQKDCRDQGIELLKYNIEEILTKFYENFKELTYFLKIKPGDFGVVRLGLLNESLKLVSEGFSVKEIAQSISKSTKTIKNRLTVASQLNLIFKHEEKYFLTDFGVECIKLASTSELSYLNSDQADLLAKFVIENPFYSPLTFGINAVVESVFILSRDEYPVRKSSLINHFVSTVGKSNTWRRSKARDTATYIFSNYAYELGLLTKIDNTFFVTPQGTQSVLLLQLNRSIKLIKSRN